MAPPLIRRSALLAALPLILIACEDPRSDASDTAGSSITELPDTIPASSAPTDSATPEVAKPKAPEPDPTLEIALNLPAGRLDLYENGSLRKSYPVSIGRVGYETPAGNFLMRRIIWNPTWYPPPSKWAEDQEPAPPGPDNPMGRAKLHLTQLIYIHGTTATHRLGHPASHGCIRMSNPSVLELARIIAAQTDAIDAQTIAKLEANPTATREVPLPRPIRVRVFYERAELRDDSLVIRPDVYARAPDPTASAKRVWSRAGRDTSDLHEERIQAAIRRGTPPKPPAPAARPAPVLLGTPVTPAAADTMMAPTPVDSIGAPASDSIAH